MTTEEIEQLVINDLVKFEKEEVKESNDRDNRITAYDLTHSSVPCKRDGKRHSDRRRIRGEENTKYYPRAIFEDREEKRVVEPTAGYFTEHIACDQQVTHSGKNRVV